MKKILFFIFFLLSATLHAQFYTTGDDPLSMRLYQIKTPYARIIYDQPMQQWAESIARQLTSDSIALNLTGRRKTDIVLHSRAAYSNGMATWAPARMELYPYAESDGDCVPWRNHLVAHESKHIREISSLNKGLTKTFYVLFGEQAIGAVLGAFVPSWYLEGDAVVSETVSSQGGRGRMGAFEQKMRTLALHDKVPKYDCAYNGSYKNYLPDYYSMGYLTISNTDLKYGSEVWTNALSDVARKWITFAPFNLSLRKTTGLRKTLLYNDAMQDWRQRWEAQDHSVIPTPYETLTSAQGDYTSFTSAVATNEGLCAYRTDPDELPSLYNITKQEKICTTSLRNEHNLTAHNDTLVWCERKNHPRWENASQEHLVMCTTDGRHRHIILRNGNFSSPAISNDGQKIAVVNTTDNAQQQILIVDFNGTIILQIPLSWDEQATSLAWTDEQLFFISLTDKGKCIKSADGKPLFVPRYENIRHLTTDGHNLYFTSDKTGIDNIYKWSKDNNIVRLTSARFGAAWPLVKNDSLYYSNYTVQGYEIVRTALSTQATDHPFSPMRKIADSLSSFSIKEYPRHPYGHDSISISRYRRMGHLFRLHSWGAVVADGDEESMHPGVSVASQNTLGNSSFSAGIDWFNDSKDRYFAKYTFSLLYPKIELSGWWGHKDYKFDGFTKKNASELTRYTYNDRQHTQHYRIAMYIPLSYCKGASIYGIQPCFSLNHYRYSPITISKNDYQIKGEENGKYIVAPTNNKQQFQYKMPNYLTLNYFLYSYWKRRTTERDVDCRLGITAQVGYEHCIAFKNCGTEIYFKSNVFLPGIGKHHSIWMQCQMQSKNSGEALHSISGSVYHPILGDACNNARGTNDVSNTDLQLFRFNYTMPIINPDWSIGPLLFVKRINLRAFYDFERFKPYHNKHIDDWKNLQSAGGEIWAECYPLRLSFPLQIGYRGTMVFDEDFHHEFIFSFSVK